MTDLQFKLDETGSDLELEGGDLRRGAALLSAVLVSLFSDARAREDDEVPDGSADPRGWALQDAGDEFGSRLWLFERSKRTERTANELREAAREALRWLERDGIAGSVEVSTALRGRHGIDLAVEITRGSAGRWATLWDDVAGTEFEAPGVRIKLLAY